MHDTSETGSAAALPAYTVTMTCQELCTCGKQQRSCLFIVRAHVQVWGIEAVEAVLDFKWRTWAKHLLWAELGAYVIWLAAFQVFVLLFQASHAAPAYLPPLCSAPGDLAASDLQNLVLH